MKRSIKFITAGLTGAALMLAAGSAFSWWGNGWGGPWGGSPWWGGYPHYGGYGPYGYGSPWGWGSPYGYGYPYGLGVPAWGAYPYAAPVAPVAPATTESGK